MSKNEDGDRLELGSMVSDSLESDMEFDEDDIGENNASSSGTSLELSGDVVGNTI